MNCVLFAKNINKYWKSQGKMETNPSEKSTELWSVTKNINKWENGKKSWKSQGIQSVQKNVGTMILSAGTTYTPKL